MQRGSTPQGGGSQESKRESLDGIDLNCDVEQTFMT